MKSSFTGIILFIGLLLTSCFSSQPAAQEQRDIDAIAWGAVIDWYNKLRNPSTSYHFDESSGRYSKKVIDRLKNEIPEFRAGKKGSWSVELSSVHFKEENFAYIEILISDPFFAEKFVHVFQNVDGEWKIVDRLTLEGGPAWMLEFDWESYQNHRRRPCMR